MIDFIESFLELIYPEKNICTMCDKYDDSIGDKYICYECEQSIKKIAPPYCIKCSKPLDYGSQANLCHDCQVFEKSFEASRSLYIYDGQIKKAIYNFKYYNKPYYYRFFGNSLVKFIREIGYLDYSCILSVPLHSLKLRQRGYNQSELVASHIAKKLNIPYVNALIRTKNTTKQSIKTKEDRRKSMKNAFEVKKGKKYQMIKNSSVLLIDDVYTTGSTADECSKTLLNYGVNKVYVLTIAR